MVLESVWITSVEVPVLLPVLASVVLPVLFPVSAPVPVPESGTCAFPDVLLLSGFIGMVIVPAFESSAEK